MRLVLTRPEPLCSELKKQLEFHGCQVLCFPTLRIDVLPCPDNNWCQFDAFIVVSQFAVQERLTFLREKPVFSVGPATAKALQKTLHVTAQFPKIHWSTEGLLALPALQDVKGKRIGIVCGENTKPVLSETLTKRGAEGVCVPVYQRSVNHKAPQEALTTWIEEGIDVLQFGSQEGYCAWKTVYHKPLFPKEIWVNSSGLLACVKQDFSTSRVRCLEQLSAACMLQAKTQFEKEWGCDTEGMETKN